MSEKQDLIKRMLELQKKFIEYEHENGLSPFDYYTPQPGHPLEGYRKEYRELANKVVDLAQEDVGSNRL
ncbi:MAG: hypothetical protein GWO16_03430 [Gammaproteobacteria bacterium]|nr:hypothetical protein [Gammaproteobacteria bacterium]NIR97155.1 hypothetical protein [Gammaproteobacteria bacterium]NIT62853.1 hypothetical protein [Gammaproteobacteria bacterium]NIV19817.1 hypothetical protein [Gammaproteobacteria bacterium]NIX11350.1 hypothetical protein [Gammaproteobacteria bacterium]